MPPTVPINHYDGPRNQQNRTKRPILLFHANIFEQYACFEHSNFFKVNASGPAGHSAKSIEGAPRGKGRGRAVARLAADRPPAPKIQLRAF